MRILLAILTASTVILMGILFLNSQEFIANERPYTCEKMLDVRCGHYENAWGEKVVCKGRMCHIEPIFK